MTLFPSSFINYDQGVNTIQQLCLDASGNIYVFDDQLGFTVLSPSGTVIVSTKVISNNSIHNSSPIMPGNSFAAVQPNGRILNIYNCNLYITKTSGSNPILQSYATTSFSYERVTIAGISFGSVIPIIDSAGTNTGLITTTNPLTNVVANATGVYIAVGTSVYSLTIAENTTPRTATATLHATLPHTTVNSFMAIDTNGQIYLTNPSLNSITIVSPSGVCTDISTGNKTPTCITVDSDNNVYYADTTKATVTKFNKYGSISIPCINNNADTYIQYSLVGTVEPDTGAVYPPLGALLATPTSIYTAYYTNTWQQVVVITKL